MTAAWLIWCDSALSSLMSSDLSDSDWCDHYSVNVIVFFFRGGWHTGILLIVKKSGQPCWYGEHWYVCLLYVHLKIQYNIVIYTLDFFWQRRTSPLLCVRRSGPSPARPFSPSLMEWGIDEGCLFWIKEDAPRSDEHHHFRWALQQK